MGFCNVWTWSDNWELGLAVISLCDRTGAPSLLLYSVRAHQARQILLTKLRLSISRAIGGPFTRGMASVSLACNRCLQGHYPHVFDFTNSVMRDEI
jgi:hypothetical protein